MEFDWQEPSFETTDVSSKEIEESLGKCAKKEYLPLQQGDVPATYSSPDLLNEWINFKPNTSVKKGISEFIKWYKDFYKSEI